MQITSTGSGEYTTQLEVEQLGIEAYLSPTWINPYLSIIEKIDQERQVADAILEEQIAESSEKDAITTEEAEIVLEEASALLDHELCKQHTDVHVKSTPW